MTGGGGSVWAGSALTDKRGHARDYWTLGPSTDPGANTLEVRAVDPTTGEKRVFATFTATGLPAPVGSVSVTPSTSTIVVGGTVQLQATVTTVDGEVVTDRVVTWTSSDEGVATVSSTGLVTGVSGDPATATITATAEGVSGTTEVTVTGGSLDPYEPNDSPFDAHVLGTSEIDGAPLVVSDATFHSGADPSDAFRVLFEEPATGCVLGATENHEVIFSVSGLPEGQYTARLYGTGPIALVKEQSFFGTSHTLTFSFTGNCGVDDDYDLVVEIAQDFAAVYGVPYTLSVSMTEG